MTTFSLFITALDYKECDKAAVWRYIKKFGVMDNETLLLNQRRMSR